MLEARHFRSIATILMLTIGMTAVPASAQRVLQGGPTVTPPPIAPPVSPPPRFETAAEALAEDAGQYALRHGLALGEAMQRLRAQEESVAATDAIQAEFQSRLAGISIEHQPAYRIVVLLTGEDPVPDRTIFAGGMQAPVVFRTGARATRQHIVDAIRDHQAEIRTLLPQSQGMGADLRTGQLVILLKARGADEGSVVEVEQQLEKLTDVPVRIRLADHQDMDLDIQGGSRLVGTDPGTGKRYACTTGFIVTDQVRTGVVTAAHCPDAITYFDPDDGETKLTFIGEWGARYQDVQVHIGEGRQKPLFYVDSNKTRVRTLTTWRNRSSTRAGDSVCHRGETSGYSCAEIELVDFAPSGDLCGGPCDPTWVTVAGPNCRGGDSGGPIFSGTVAFGIVKGGSYIEGVCSFYYYMSTDYLPAGWTLLHG